MGMHYYQSIWRWYKSDTDLAEFVHPVMMSIVVLSPGILNSMSELTLLPTKKINYWHIFAELGVVCYMHLYCTMDLSECKIMKGVYTAITVL